MRVAAGLASAIVAACSAPERSAPPAPTANRLQLAPPGLRLPDVATPLAYDVRLEIDPEREQFHGRVAIETRIERPTDHVWLHAEDLVIGDARWDGGALALDPVEGDQMRAFRFGRTVAPGTITIAIEFTGMIGTEHEGLFRQRAGGDWYVFSQGQAVHARKIVPCFDEPQFKTPWRVSLVVPARHVALANMPQQDVRVRDDRTKEVTFAASRPISSYLLAVAVGPFDVVEIGALGRDRVPARVAVRAGDGARVGVAAARLPAIVDALEAYTGTSLPWPKLDLVAVPELFGAMENPGLVTFDEPMLVGSPRDRAHADYFTQIAAHELAHQWFGNLVTPAWWDDLWLSEAFASWLGNRVARELGAFEEPVLALATARRRAIEADDAPDAVPLRRAIETNADPDEPFEAIYDKGELVLATLEAWLGDVALRDAVRGYLAAHRDGTATLAGLGAALAGQPGAAGAVVDLVTRVGVPVVDLALACDGTPRLEARVRDGRQVPICVRHAAARGPAEVCALAGARTELRLPACPAWVIGNARGGYYHVAWQSYRPRGLTSRAASNDPQATLIGGDDLAAAVGRGELAAPDIIRELRALASSRDRYAHLAAAVVATRLDRFVDETTRPAWIAWIVGRFAAGFNTPARATDVDLELVRMLVDLVPPERLPIESSAIRASLAIVDRSIADGAREPTAALVTLAAAAPGSGELWSRIVARARAMRDDSARGAWFAVLGQFGPSRAGDAAALLVDPAVPLADGLAVVAPMLARGVTRDATWRAVHARLADVLARATPQEQGDLLDATATLCDARARAQVLAAFEAGVTHMEDGAARLAAALSAIESCIAIRARLGDLAAALGSP